MSFRLIALILAGMTLAACGGDGSSSATDAEVADSTAAAPASTSPKASPAEPEASEGHCALVSREEIEALFPMPLNLGELMVVGQPDNPFHACQVELGIGEVGQLSFGTTNEGMYNEYAKYLDRSSTPSRRIEGLGEEAFLLNNAQLLIRREDGQFLNVAVMLIMMTELPLSQEQIADAVIELGTRVDERL